MKQSTILSIFGLSLLFIMSFLTVFADEAPDLPDDNLIANPWFRDANNVTGSHDGWVVGEEWGLSQKNHNPTPDEVQGTSARLGTPKGSPGVDSIIFTVVKADQANTILRFQTWQVSRNLHEEKVTIYGADSSDGPWIDVWQPWVETNSSVQWVQVPLLETTIEKGYPYYKVEFMCNYWQGTAGCKYTGVYFTASDVSDPNAEGETAVSSPTTSDSSGNRGESGNRGSNNNATEQFGLDELSATAVSGTEIILKWPEGNDAALQFQVQRSLDGQSNWSAVSIINADAASFVDSGLTPETIYYYRIQVSVPGSGRLRSEVVSSFTALPEIAPSPIAEPIAERPTKTPAPVEPAPVAETAVFATSTPISTTAFEETQADANPWTGTAFGFVGGILFAGLIGWMLIRRQK